MTITREIGIIILCSLLSNSVLGQLVCSSILQDKIEEICVENESWKFIYHNNNKITLVFNGNFTTNTILGPKAVTKKELNRPDANSISFDFLTSEGWSDSMYINVKNNNTLLLEELKSEYINHYDSIGWPPKRSKSRFETNPMDYLKNFKYKSEELYNEIVKLPDFRINECGVWVNPSIDFSIFYIVQPDTRDTINLIIQDIIALDTYVKNSIDGIPNY